MDALLLRSDVMISIKILALYRRRGQERERGGWMRMGTDP